jgi:hypothetical protein
MSSMPRPSRRPVYALGDAVGANSPHPWLTVTPPLRSRMELLARPQSGAATASVRRMRSFNSITAGASSRTSVSKGSAEDTLTFSA